MLEMGAKAAIAVTFVDNSGCTLSVETRAFHIPGVGKHVFFPSVAAEKGHVTHVTGASTGQYSCLRQERQQALASDFGLTRLTTREGTTTTTASTPETDVIDVESLQDSSSDDNTGQDIIGENSYDTARARGNQGQDDNDNGAQDSGGDASHQEHGTQADIVYNYAWENGTQDNREDNNVVDHRTQGNREET